MSTIDYREFLEDLMVGAGNIILSHRDDYKIVDKPSNEIVTEADLSSNDFIVGKLKKTGLEIYSEESNMTPGKGGRWIVDPLDGTTPWVWGNSGFSISIALENEQGHIIIGAVYDPVFKEFFYAESGKGAYKNKLRINVSKINDIKQTLVVCDWGNKHISEGLDYFSHLLLPEMKVRRAVPQFAPALGLCKIAEGRTHALVCNDTWMEDHSAGSLILQEAGGVCMNFHNRTGFDHKIPGIIACCNQKIYEQILECLDK